MDAGEAVVLAGDFNLQPDDPGLRPVLGQGFVDAAPSGTTQARTGLPDRKIDYVFTHRDSFPKATGRGRIEDTADQCPGSGTSRCSDHHRVWAELNATSG
ncbi:endonuclease/exonuclease/phosphatase family protein [Streptomyces albus]|uniref:endonuclease/exonuclease/phosphatase family protein n=1 Tax=Streptomyces albus TaxID=1888 RepID=UPI0004C8BBCF|nr:endonuclease/exonuclease/phosphatase family protein [Streptomyces albus]